MWFTHLPIDAATVVAVENTFVQVIMGKLSDVLNSLQAALVQCREWVVLFSQMVIVEKVG
jgi:hypothetical protein